MVAGGFSLPFTISMFSEILRLRFATSFGGSSALISVFGFLTTGKRVLIPTGGRVAHSVFKLISSRLGMASDLFKRSLSLMSGYIFVGKPGGSACTFSGSFFSKGFALNNFMISASLAFDSAGD